MLYSDPPPPLGPQTISIYLVCDSVIGGWPFRLGCAPGLMWAAVLGSAGLTHILWLTVSWLLRAGFDWGNWDTSALLHGPLTVQQASRGMFSRWWQRDQNASRNTLFQAHFLNCIFQNASSTFSNLSVSHGCHPLRHNELHDWIQNWGVEKYATWCEELPCHVAKDMDTKKAWRIGSISVISLPQRDNSAFAP